MLLVFPLTAAKIVGTDIFHAAALLWVAGISYLVHGNVDLGAMGWLLLGSIPGVLFASKLTVRVPEGALRVGLGTVLLASGVRLIEFPAYEMLVPVILVLGAIAAGLTEVRRLNARAVSGSLGNHRRRVVAPFPAGALGKIGERRSLEDVDRRVSDLAPGLPQGVGDELRRGSGIAPRRVADRRELALEEPHDALERDLLGRLVQPVAAGGPALGAHDPGGAHDRHHLLEHGLGGARAACELLELHRLRRRRARAREGPASRSQFVVRPTCAVIVAGSRLTVGGAPINSMPRNLDINSKDYRLIRGDDGTHYRSVWQLWPLPQRSWQRASRPGARRRKRRAARCASWRTRRRVRHTRS